ncbi:MAG: hypothetical protein QM831_31850 [Kofleriaceae bacterium]
MKKWVLVLLAACGDSQARVPDANVADAYVSQSVPVYDAYYGFCDASDTSSMVTVSGSQTTRMFVGGVDLFPPESDPLSHVYVTMWFTTQDHLSLNDPCLVAQGCTTPGVTVRTNMLTGPGTYQADIMSLDSAVTTASTGTVTFTNYESPLRTDIASPGNVTGTITTDDHSVTGSFSGGFCRGLLAFTI